MPQGPAQHAYDCNGTESFKSLVIEATSDWSFSASLLAVTSCQHQTAIVCGVDELADPSSSGGTVGAGGHAVTVAKRLWAEKSRSGSHSDFLDDFRSWLRTEIDIKLNESIRYPYSMALRWSATTDASQSHEFLTRLITARAALSDIFTVSRTQGVDSQILESIDHTSRRIEVALVSLTAWQTVILDNAARKLAEASERRAKEERERDRRIADLGAVTLFPLLIFSFLGSNVLPASTFPFTLRGPIWLALSVVFALCAAIAGRAWIRTWNGPGSSDEKPKGGLPK